ncbi:MAG: FtsK/SpoIIIE domain-containing protein [Acidimicrobiales bacterium]
MPQRSNEAQLIDEVPLLLRRHWSLLVFAILLVAAFVLGGRWALAVLAVLWGVFVPAPLNLPRRCLRTISHPDGAPLLRARLFRQVLASCPGVKLPVRLIFEDYEREGKYLDPRSETFEVRLWPGEHLELWRSGRGEALRHGFEAERVKVTEARPGVVRVRLSYWEVLSLLEHMEPPHIFQDKPVDFLSDPVPLGHSEEEEPVTITLAGSHLLIGGQPGSGKSLIHLIVAWAALDPAVRLVLLDGKQLSELGWWAPVADAVAGTLAEAVSVLEDVEEERLRRAKERYQRHLRTWPPGAIRPILVAIDELAVFTDAGGVLDKERRGEVARFQRLLGDLVRLGRADQIMVVAATQKPDSEVVPTGIRDEFPLRVALRCGTREHSDVILGSGSAAAGFDASALPPVPGYFICRGGAGEPVTGRAWYASDERLKVLLNEATKRRRPPPPAVLSLPPGFMV